MSEKLIYFVYGPRRSGVSTLIDKLKQNHDSHAVIDDPKDLFNHYNTDVVFFESHVPYVNDGPNATFPWKEGYFGELSMAPKRTLIEVNVAHQPNKL
jgi:AAA+ ATPase superfamily predicted ATPase